MHGYHSHPYVVQSAAFFIGLIPFVLLFVMLAGAKFFDGLRRARKPAPARPPAIMPLARRRTLLPAVD